MHRSDAIHLNFILCKYYDFITADLKVYSDRKTQRNQKNSTKSEITLPEFQENHLGQDGKSSSQIFCSKKSKAEQTASSE